MSEPLVTVTQLADQLEEAAADAAVRVVVLTGSAKAFCAGADIAEIEQMVGASPLDRMPFDRLFDTVAALPVPTIAAVRGPAVGGGCELVLACDTAVAGRSARFAVPEGKLGVIPGAGGTQRLVHAIGKAKAMRMLLTGPPSARSWPTTRASSQTSSTTTCCPVFCRSPLRSRPTLPAPWRTRLTPPDARPR